MADRQGSHLGQSVSRFTEEYHFIILISCTVMLSTYSITLLSDQIFPSIAEVVISMVNRDEESRFQEQSHYLSFVSEQEQTQFTIS